MLATTYLGALEQPKVRELIAIHGKPQIQSMIEFELINLAALMSVGGNLNDAQITFIADGLIEQYPTESIADFKLCFKKGALGAYGDIQRMDGITIGKWMNAYLEAKYEAVEANLMKEKENIYKPVEVEPSNVDWHKRWLDELKAIEAPKRIPMTNKEIQEQGQLRAKVKSYVPTDAAYLQQHERHHAWIRANFHYLTGDKLPGWIEEKEWIALTYKH